MEDSEYLHQRVGGRDRHQRVDGKVIVIVKGLTKKIVIIRGMMER